MEISIVILSYKMKRLVKNCIKTIQESCINVPYEIIVVDNDSGDGIKAYLTEHYPDIPVYISDKNLGMGGGNNIGIKKARGKYILIMNPDIFVFPDSIENMYNYIKGQRSVGLVSPRLLNPDKSLQHTCYRWHKPLTPLYRRTALGKLSIAQKQIDHFLMKDFDHQAVKEVPWCQGSCIMVPKEVFDQVGLFDEDFFMYFEDTDLCRRIWHAGYKVVYHGSTQVIHMHMRMSRGGVLKVITNRLTREHIKSWIKYSLKHRKKTKPQIK